MQVAIIAGGLATRLGELTRDLPKSLIPVGGKPFIEHQLKFLKEAGISDIVLCVGHMGSRIEDYCGDGRRFGMKIKYSREDKPLDTAGALKEAEQLLDNAFFTLYGDSYVNMDFADMWSFFEHQDKPAVMSVYQNCNKYDKSNTSIDNSLVKEYDKSKWEQMSYIDYGVNLFRKEVLSLVPKSRPYSLGALFQQLIARKELLAYEVKERFYQIGDKNGLQEFSEYIGNKI
jgi:N-acetyl-alpha-D-muramate 1-phosphate uridylyltransferase